MLAVAAPLGLAGVERGVDADRHQRVLQRAAAAAVHVHVVRRHHRQPEPARERPPGLHADAVAALERPLQLDPQPPLERLGQPPHLRLALDPVAGAAGQAEQPAGQLEHVGERRGGLRGGAVGTVAGVGVRAGDELAQVLVAVPLGDQQREVPVLAADVDRQLAAGDRLQARRGGRLREHERAAEVVVVGQRERRVPLQDGAVDQLLGVGGAVQEGEGGVAVELGIGSHLPILPEHLFVWNRPR